MARGLAIARSAGSVEGQTGELPDAASRAQALDVGRSWVVEAPAGSGKTGLLIQRFLRLLASEGVEAPEEVLAITFTKAATAEMRERVLGQLRAAQSGEPPKDSFAAETRPMADAVLRRDRQLRWGLLQAPQRLRVQTIDALCAEIARATPVLSGGGGTLRPVEDAFALYEEAAQRTWAQMGGADAALSQALEDVLLSQEANLETCIELLAKMLETREQWGELLPLEPGDLTDEALEGEVRPRLDRALEKVVCAALTELQQAIGPGPLQELTAMAAVLAGRPALPKTVSTLAICRELRRVPGTAAEHLEHWRALSFVLLTKGHGWRKRFLPKDLHVQRTAEDSRRLTEMLDGHRGNDGLLAALRRMRALPDARYPEQSWAMAKSLLRILARALVELKAVFGERGECDFIEPALLARRVLDRMAGEADRPAAELKHLLVDEMQDTSTWQYGLLERLTAGWAGTGRTVFLVGDPKQSIYLFRHARVERFLRTMRTERLGEMEVGLLRLTANFRSQGRLVRDFNLDFGAVFAPEGEASADEAGYTSAVAARGEAEQGGRAWHLWQSTNIGAVVREQARRNAREIRCLIDGWQQRSAERSKPLRIAVLGSSRASLQAVMRALQAEQRVAYRAISIEPLAERREVLDLLALTRALLHPADRIAWLAVLRAPWCGLDLAALHRLTGNDARDTAACTVRQMVWEQRDGLTADSRSRLDRVWPALEAAIEMRERVRLPELVERTWRSLGGEALLAEAARKNAHRYLEMLRSIDKERGEVTEAEVQRRLTKLYAAPETQAPDLELMTIHGAKGLEWDVVVIPEMERAGVRDERRLLAWEELPEGVLLAPLHEKGEEASPLSKWIRDLGAQRSAAERRRLLYVACTRAREELHLFGVVQRASDGALKPTPKTLLEAAWPAARGHAAEHGQETPPSLAGRVETLVAGAAKKPARLERVPVAYRHFPAPVPGAETEIAEGSDALPRKPVFARPHGSLAARALGNAVHALLEEAARRLAGGTSAEDLRREAGTWTARAETLLRSEGMAPAVAREQAAVVRSALQGTLGDPTGAWLLGQQPGARSEFALTMGAQQPQHFRMDRIFRGGSTPGEQGESCSWIIDYKTATHGARGVEAFLDDEREKYRDQMEAYAGALGVEGVRVGLWYPLLRRLVWWQAPERPAIAD